MPTTLPPALDLLRDSWRLFISTWKHTIRVSGWLFVVSLAYPLLFVLAKNNQPASAVLFIPHFVVLSVVAMWVSIRLMQLLLAFDKGHTPDLSRTASMGVWKLVWPFLLLAILQGLIVFGGVLLLILPGIYLAIALSNSGILLVDKQLRNFQAITASYELVKNRWWQTFWRILSAGVLFGLGTSFMVWAMQALLLKAARVSPTQTDVQDPILAGGLLLIEFFFQAALTPLFVAFQVKLYQALQRTKNV